MRRINYWKNVYRTEMQDGQQEVNPALPAVQGSNVEERPSLPGMLEGGC
jgi:hypothetical protein